PLSLGIETLGGVMTRLVERNSTIPTAADETFSTAADGQTSVTIKIYQGEREMAASNRLLNEFDLSDIPPAPRNVPKIQVKFDIDENGILKVSAKDLGTGKEQEITIKESSGLSEDEIGDMRADAEEHAEEDKRKRELADARNQADSGAYQTEKFIKDNAEKLSDADKEAVDKAIEKVKETVKEEDVEAIKSAADELQQVTFAMTEALYQQAASEQPAEGDGEAKAETTADDDAIDAEFEVKDSE
ncbi:MAG: Hsp70 family protein, partial [Planctomycetales bacterium]